MAWYIAGSCCVIAPFIGVFIILYIIISKSVSTICFRIFLILKFVELFFNDVLVNYHDCICCRSFDLNPLRLVGHESTWKPIQNCIFHFKFLTFFYKRKKYVWEVKLNSDDGCIVYPMWIFVLWRSWSKL